LAQLIMARTWSVSILLLKAGTEAPATVFGSRAEGLDVYDVNAGATTGTLYVSRTPAASPDWTRLFAGRTDRALDIQRPNFGAVFLLEASRRWFAVTFGTGRHLIEPGCFERRFGLKAALNLVDPGALRSAQSRTFDESALHVRRQSSRLNDIVGLDVNMDRDLLVDLAGATTAGEIGKRISGSDAARLTDEFDLRELKSRCTALLNASRRKTYRKHFRWVDKVEHLQDSGTVDALDAKAAGRLLKLDLDGVDVYPPELVDETIAAFRTPTGATIMEPEPAWLKRLIGKIAAPDAATLKHELARLQLKAVDGNGDVVKIWSTWECVYLEAKINGQTYVLDRGDWYRIERSFAKTVNDFVAALQPSGLALPDALHNEVEGAYNARVAKCVPELLLADKDLVRPVPGESRVEVCDLFSDQGHMIHVKRRKGGSSSLSHLFGQALVSGLLLAREPQYVDGVRKMLAKQGHMLPRQVKPGDHPVVLALMMPKLTGNRGNLPFFSKVNLREHVRPLQTAGFEVFLDEIEAPIDNITGHAGKTSTRSRRR
jgi:uncharacterized protein (TIGR04141 family)